MQPEKDIVCMVLETPFSTWKEADKRDVIFTNRPIPELTASTFSKKQGKQFTRSFRAVWYEHYKWLCGSVYKLALFCWPCLLMAKNKTTWNTTGYNDFKNIARSSKMHESSRDHMQACIGMKRLEKNRESVAELLQQHSLVTKAMFNEKVRINR